MTWTKTLTGTLTASVAYIYTNTDEIGAPRESTTAQNKTTYTSGGGDDQLDVMFRQEYTLTTGSPDQDIDLRGVLEDVFGEEVNMGRLKIILIRNLSETAGDDVLFGPLGQANGMACIFDDDLDGKVTIRNGGCLLLEAPGDGYILNDDEHLVRLSYDGTSGEIDVDALFLGVTTGVVSSSSSSVIFSSSSSSSSVGQSSSSSSSTSTSTSSKSSSSSSTTSSGSSSSSSVALSSSSSSSEKFSSSSSSVAFSSSSSSVAFSSSSIQACSSSSSSSSSTSSVGTSSSESTSSNG